MCALTHRTFELKLQKDIVEIVMRPWTVQARQYYTERISPMGYISKKNISLWQPLLEGGLKHKSQNVFLRFLSKVRRCKGVTLDNDKNIK